MSESKRASIPTRLIATVLIESEYRQAIDWRERFLDGLDVEPLDNQLVAYLIADAEQLREIGKWADGDGTR